MSAPPQWLPDLVYLQDYGGEWAQYFEAIYKYFVDDFVKSKPKFGKRAVNVKHNPLESGKEATFWHITHEGKIESERTPDMRRCERIRWPRPMIEHHDDNAIRCWPNKRGRDKRIVLWLHAKDYVVVLSDRKRYVLLWTAYYISYNHTRQKLQKEYEEYQKSLMPPSSDDIVTPSTHGR